MARQEDAQESAVDLILQNLSRRPNVRSTLILSRKDGSIIKTSGAIAQDGATVPGHSRNFRSTELSSPPAKAEEDALTEDDGQDLKSQSASNTRLLASSIFGFVAAATALGESVCSIEQGNQSLTGRASAEKESQDTKPGISSQSQPDGDVQLLRLRLKKQEIIIFPDPNYLCCVVQDLEKNLR